jgi:hypothetical protein
MLARLTLPTLLVGQRQLRLGWGALFDAANSSIGFGFRSRQIVPRAGPLQFFAG